MVLLTLTPTAKTAIEDYLKLVCKSDGSPDQRSKLENAKTGDPVEHQDLVEVSRFLIQKAKTETTDPGLSNRQWRLDAMLKGTTVYKAPPAPKAEPTPEYKALMQSLRLQEEKRQYERMINPVPAPETFNQRFPGASASFNPHTSHGQTGVDETEDMTFQDVDRQMALIINVLISIICCAVAIWMAARHWSVPQRLGLSMGGSLTVAVAEVAIYLGYIRRISEAKGTELKKAETKEIQETWVIEKTASTEKKSSLLDDGVRHRKGKHR